MISLIIAQEIGLTFKLGLRKGAWAASVGGLLLMQLIPSLHLDQSNAVAQTPQPLPQLFETSATCLGCHNMLVTPTGKDVSIGSDWRGSMMANAARDPYWQAAVRRESIDHPVAAAAIENECSTCHMPMAHHQASLNSQSAQVFAHLPVRPSAAAAGIQAQLAADGVGCTTCHQMTDANLGARETFVGRFAIDTVSAPGNRKIYGPFDVDQGRSRIMHSASGFLPEKGAHVQAAELCASCHTLITHAMNDQHEVVGELPEQVPYLEWLHSDYANERSCQSCHMPIEPDSVAVSSVLGRRRSDVNRHVFRGGNFLIPRLFSRFGAELGIEATAAELQASIERTIDHLRSSAAGLEIETARFENGQLVADFVITNRAGHKLPTAYPSRRAWLHIVVADAEDHIVFESGALNDDGSIVGNDNDILGDAFEPHYEVISGPEQVQIYEAIMEDPQGKVTTGLTSGIRYVKDNRIVPKGFDKTTAAEDVAVRGRALEDADFRAQSDRLRIELAGDFNSRQYVVRAELLYQPVGYRWAANLGDYQAMETQRFAKYYRDISKASAVVLASDTQSVFGP